MAVFEVQLKDGVSGPAGAASASLGQLSSGLSGAGGASEGLAGKLSGLASDIDPVALAAKVATAAVVALGAALIGGALAAISINQTRDAMYSMFEALGDGPGAAQKTMDMLDRLGKQLPFTKGQMAEWAKSLMSAGVQGADLERAIKAVASSTAIMGEAGGAATQKLIKKFESAAEAGLKVKIDKGTLKQLAMAGISANDLADALHVTPDKLAKMTVTADQLGKAMEDALIKKGKGPLEDLGLTWESISGKLSSGFKSLFKDLGPDVKAFMTSVKSLFEEFSSGGVAANGAKSVVTSVFQTVFAVATRVVNAIHIGFLTLELTYYRVATAIKPITDGLKRLLGATSGADVMIKIIKGLAVVFGLLAVAVVISLIPLVLLGAAIVAVGVMIYEAIAAIVAFNDWIMGLGRSVGEGIGEAVAWVATLPAALASMASDAIAAGENFILGLVDSITGGGARVVGAVLGIAKSAVGALKGALGIASRSKVTYAMGGYTTQGLAESIEDGAADVHAAAKGTGKAAITGTRDGLDGAAGAAGAAGLGGAGKGGLHVTVEAGAVVIHGGGGDTMALTEEALSSLLERLALQQGLASA